MVDFDISCMSLYELYCLYDKHNSDKDHIIKHTLTIITKLVKRESDSKNYNEHDDILQEVHFKVYTIFEQRKFKFHEDQIKPSHTEKFINETHENSLLFDNKNRSKKDKEIYLNALAYFVGKISFQEYIKKTIKHAKIDFYKNNKDKQNVIFDNIVIHSYVQEKEKYPNFEDLTQYLDAKDMIFLKTFITTTQSLNQSEVAKKLNVSKAYISKRYNAIANKIKNAKNYKNKFF